MFFSFSKRLLAPAVLFCALLGACDSVTEVSPKADDQAVTDSSILYTISKGAHYSDKNTFKQLATSGLKFKVTFDSSAVYTSKAPNNQADINKLYGFSDCGSLHHFNSARFGWRWYNNRLELLAYTYVNTQVKYELISAITIGEPILCELQVKDGQYRFVVGQKEVLMPRGCSGDMSGYQLYPYFGGDEVAPHDITIKINEVE